jgi:hypothetical protein
MKHLLTIFLVLLIFSQSALAKEERIKFHVKFGFIKGGVVVMVVKDTVFNDRAAIHYSIDGRTTGITNAIYRVHDIYETTVDAETYLPLKAIRSIKEGSYKRYNETLFYHNIDSLHSQRKGWSEMPNNLVDIISGFFYFINRNPFSNLQAGDAVAYSIYHADKIMDVKIKYLREETIKTDIGKINCLVLSPLIDKGKMFNRSDGIKIYISKENKSLVYIVLETTFGSLKAVTKHYSIDGVEQSIK